MLFKSNSVSLWNIWGHYTVFQNIDTGLCLIWSDLLVIPGTFLVNFFSSLLKVSCKSLEKAFVYSKSQTYKNIRGIFSNFNKFKKLIPRLFSLNFSSKFLRWNSVSLKLESTNFHWSYNHKLRENNCRTLDFWVFPEQLLFHMKLHLLKKCKPPM